MRLVTRCAALTALLAAAALPAALAAERAAVTVYSGGVDLQPAASFASATLTVAGNGVTFSRIVARDGDLSIGPFDAEGQLLPDGVYRWQLQLLPDPATAARLRAAAQESGGRPADAWTAQSGSFAIRGGIVADGSQVEEQARLRAADVSEPASRSAFAADRGPGIDGDAAVGSSLGYEARANSLAGGAVPVSAAPGVLQQPGREALEDSDGMTVAAGRSLEPGASSDNQFSAQSRGFVPQPRSDGSNGRPRS